MVLSGASGTATRTASRDRVRVLGMVVDEWRITPSTPGLPPHLLAVVDVSGGVVGRHVLVVADPHEDRMEALGELELPQALAVQPFAVATMPVRKAEEARILALLLAHMAVDGVLPVDPADDAYARLWALAVTVLCRVCTDPDATPHGRGEGAGLTL